jgi:hypothetical protein
VRKWPINADVRALPQALARVMILQQCCLCYKEINLMSPSGNVKKKIGTMQKNVQQLKIKNAVDFLTIIIYIDVFEELRQIIREAHFHRGWRKRYV